MKFLKIFSSLARRARPSRITPVTFEDQATIPDVTFQGAEIDEFQYYNAASTSLVNALERLRQSPVIGEISIKNDTDPTITRVIARFPPDNFLYAPEAGYIMEVFDVKTHHPKGKLAPTYEALRWHIDSIFLPETVDGTFEGQPVHNLGQLVGTILRRTDGLVFFDDTPPAARGFAAALGSPRPS